MNRYNKTKNSVRNSLFGMMFRMINLIGAFIVRTILIRIMGMEFVGLDGLFSSVLQFLNLAELGFSSAIVFKLYKPIAEHDEVMVCALLTYYRSIYRIIGSIILIAGLAIIPILPKFISGSVSEGINIYVLYIIYLLNTCLSYWLFSYRTAILNASQRNDLSSKVSSVVLLFKYAAQILLLLIFKNYYIYILVIPITTLLTNLGNMFITNKYFPQYICKGEIQRSDRKEINQKVKALVYDKIGVAIINGSDNMIISSFLGLNVLGVYNSYYYIFNMLHSFFDVFHTAITGGIGNSIVTDSPQQNYSLFRRIGFVNNWMVGWCSICLLCLYKPFMTIWIGYEYVLPSMFSLLMSLYFYFWMIRFITIIFKNVQGLWWEDRYRALIESIFNFILNIIMVKIIGLYGVVLSTIVAMLVISFPWEIHVLYSKYFKVSDIAFYKDLIMRFGVTVVAGGLTFLICQFINFSPIVTLILSVLICLIVTNLIFYLFFRKTDEYHFMVGMIKRVGSLYLHKYIKK